MATKTHGIWQVVDEVLRVGVRPASFVRWNVRVDGQSVEGSSIQERFGLVARHCQVRSVGELLWDF